MSTTLYVNKAGDKVRLDEADKASVKQYTEAGYEPATAAAEGAEPAEAPKQPEPTKPAGAL